MPREERTEKATPKKREDVRKKEGMVARSADLTSATMLLCSVLILRFWGPALFRHFAVVMERGVSAAAWAPGKEETGAALRTGIIDVMLQLAPLVLALFALALLVNALQVKLYFVPKALAFKGERINPLQGMKRLLSPRSLVEVAKNLLKVGLVGAVAYFAVKDGYVRLHAMTGAGAGELLASFMGLLFSACLKVALVMVFLGGMDYAYQRWEFEKNIRMTKQEIKEEFKQTEGDPHLRAALRQRMRQLARQRMMQRLPQATLVVTNPTHFAVALLYKRGMRAPKVIAKGADFMARRIREEAERLGIPMVEEPELARSLYRMVDLEDEIPPQLYRAVAEVLAYVMSVDRRVAERIA